MPPRSGATAEQVWLYREAERLTELFCAKVREGDDGQADEFVQRREALLERIEAAGAPPPSEGGDAGDPEPYARERAAAIERIIELNRELVTLLEVRLTHVRKALAELGLRRETLTSYHGPAPTSPAFVDQIG